MKHYTWTEFKEEKIFKELIGFYRMLFSKEKGENKKKWDSVVFVTKKAYCLFLLLIKKGLIDPGTCRVYSDVYIMKNLDESLFQNENICLVDDTISTGKHFIGIHKVIKERTSVDKINCYVFMKSESLKNSKDFLKYTKSNEVNLISWLETEQSQNKIIRFGSILTLLFHQEYIPYTVELPILTEKNKEYIELTKEEFARLKFGDGLWDFYECSQAGFYQNEILNAVMIYNGDIITAIHKNFIFKFAVRIQIVKNGEDYRIVALPFPILKSVDFNELYTLFRRIYDSTTYGNKIEEYKKGHLGDFAEWSYMAIYRAVSYSLSMYIGELFQSYLEDITEGKELEYFDIHQKYSFETDFLESTAMIFQDQNNLYLFRVLMTDDFNEVKCQNRLIPYVRKYAGHTCDYKTLFMLIHEIIEEVRCNQILNVSSKVDIVQSEKFISITELQELIYSIYPTDEKKVLDILMIMCITGMLGQGKIANAICYDANENIVYRGFEYGENSEAFLELSAKIFYVALKQFIDKGHYSAYEKNYIGFLNALRFFLIKNRLWGNVVTNDDFRILSRIFEVHDEESLMKSIHDREFIGEDVEDPVYISKLKSYIEMSDIY